MLKRDRRELELVLLDLRRAKEFIRNDRTAICRTGGPATTTLHMTRPMDGAVFYEINKEYGSQLCGLDEGIRKLERMLEPPHSQLDDVVKSLHLESRGLK